MARAPSPVVGVPARGRLWPKVVGTLAGVFLGGVFLVAVYGKMFDPAAFAEAIELEGLTFSLGGLDVSANWIALFALGLEAAVGVALVLNLRRLWVLIPTGALVLFFLFLTARAYLAYLRGEEPASASCGCFGGLVDRTPTEAFWQDLALLLPAFLLAWLGRPRGPFPVVRTSVAALFAIGVAVFSFKAPDLPLDDFATRLKPGLALEELCVGEGDDAFCLLGPEGAAELAQGHYVVILADLKDEAFAGLILERLDDVFELLGELDMPGVFLLHSGKKEAEQAFKFRAGEPPLEFRPVPASLLRPLYRTLPRTFVVKNGRVTRTFSGFPPLSELRSP